MPIDPTIALHAGDAAAKIQEGSPLLPQNLNNLIGIAGASQELAAKNAAADVYKGAVGPDGAVDTNKLISGFSHGPASYLAGPLIAQALHNQGAMIEQQNARRTIMQNSLSSLLQDRDLTHGKINDNITMLVRQGLLSPQMGLDESKQYLGKDGQFDAPSAKLRLTEHLINAMTPEQRQGFLFGNPTIVGGGDQQHVMMLGPNGAQSLASVKMGISPEGAISQAAGQVTQGGATTLVPGATRAQQLGIGGSSLQGGGGVAPGGGPGQGPATNTAPAAPIGSGRFGAAGDIESLRRMTPAQRASWAARATDAQKQALRDALQKRIGMP